MFYYHKIEKKNNEEVLYLYLDYNYEISSDFFNKKNLQKSLVKNIKQYIKNEKIKFLGKTVLLVVGGTTMATVTLKTINKNSAKLSNNFNYVATLNINEEETNIIPEEEKEITIETDKIKITLPKEPESTTTPTKVIQEEAKESIIKPEEPTTPIKQLDEPEPDIIAEKPTEIVGKTITISTTNGNIVIPFEDYIIGVVAAEMPASFNNEALKAQSVAARTYALKRISAGKTISATSSDQIYKTESQLKAFWGTSYNYYYSKVQNAVLATKDEYIAYNGSYIDALYHSTSNGSTEMANEVWTYSFPYLISVDSHWDLSASSYLREVSFTLKEVSDILGFDVNINTNIEILSKTTGNNINEIKIGEKVYSGKALRESFSLRSTDFNININETNVIFITRGYGHGVGMSQYGANGMANAGYSYKQILTHYYTNTTITK